MSSTLTAAELQQAGLTINSWGGNPSTRYNYDIGHAWNHGADFEFRNTNYSDPGPDSALNYVPANAAAGVQTRMAIPTLGWVAKNDDPDDCSFPKDGGCLPAAEVGNCEDPKVEADPTRPTWRAPRTRSAPGCARWRPPTARAASSSRWTTSPTCGATRTTTSTRTCPTYEEILDKYLQYAAVVARGDARRRADRTGAVLLVRLLAHRAGPGRRRR